MDIDALAAARREEWSRLERLARSRRGGRDADELIERYQTGNADLSELRTAVGSSAAGDRLSVLLSRARLRLTGTTAGGAERLAAFFVLQLPAALFRLRWWTLWVAVASVALAVLYGVWTAGDPRVLATLGSDAELREYVDESFVGYYSEFGEPAFAARVFTNNAWIAAQCIAFGITGLWVPYVLLQNASNVGMAGGAMFAYGEGDTFLLYLAPHGLLELTSIFVAGAAGLKIFWSWVVPGGRTRIRALAEEGRALFTVAIGVALSLLVSGVVEGYVTRQDWPWAVKIGIGAVALGGFLWFMLVPGRRAARTGATGDLDAFEAGATEAVAS